MLDNFKKMKPFKRNEQEKLPQQAGLTSHPFVQLHRDMNDLFGRFFDGDSLFSRSSLFPSSSFDGWLGDFSPSSFAPSVDIADEPKYLKVTADIPGIEADDIELDVRENALIIRGEKRMDESSEESGRYFRTERAYGSFERAIPLPAEVDADHAEAVFKNGVLSVRLPKVPAKTEQRKVIKVKSE